MDTKRRMDRFFYNSVSLSRTGTCCKQVNPLSHPFLPFATLEIRVINGYGDNPFVSIAHFYKKKTLLNNQYQIPPFIMFEKGHIFS